MSLYLDQFSPDHNFPPIDTPQKILVIASTGRCGSHMLGHALHKTGKFGFPLEYANRQNLAKWHEILGTNTIEQAIAELQKIRTTPNGVFGIKVHYPHLDEFGGFLSLKSLFPNAYFVLLSRDDLLKQAISLSIAKQTGVWIGGQEAVNENAVYNFEHINDCLKETILNNASWRYTLATSGSKYIELNFNDVRENLTDTIKHIAKFIEIDISNEDIPEKQVTRKQSNNINAQWEDRFLSEFNKNHVLLPNQKSSDRSSLFDKLNALFRQ